MDGAPWLHGPDTLPCLCRLLALRSSEMTCIFPPCLDGIRVLIECHVVTLSSFLKKYSECFTRDLRPQVRAAFCALIGHLPLSDTSEMELLKYQKQLWTLFFNEDEHNVVRASCLDALACFPDLTVAGLPEKEGYKVQLSPEGKPITLEESVPASLFTVGRVSFICNHSNSSCLQKAFSNFISARIRHDVRRLPRSAITHHQGHRSSQSTRQARPLTSSLAQIPRLQQSFFHQNNKDIHAQAAVGLLLTYNPPMKTDQSGAAANKSAAVQHSNSFVSMFRSLIEAVPIFDANDWFMSLACLPQWHLLVERAFVSLTNGRKAECGDNEQSKLFASLWARDQLITIAAEVGSGNGVIAICSLVTVVHEFDKTLKLKERLQMDSQHQYNIPDSTGDKYLSHAEWPLRALRSLLRLVQKRPIDDSYFAHLLAKFTRTASSTEKAIGAVLFSVHQMLPLLQSQGLLHDALKCFTIKAQHEEFLVAVGAGLMIQKLVFRGIIDVAEDIRKICEDIAQKFIAWTFDSDNSTVRSPSYLIGTTLAMSGLCSVRMLQAVAQPFCARIIGLLRTSSSTTPRESSVPSDTHQTATVSSSSSSQWESSENDADTFDEITALCCAVMAINGRQFVLKNDGIQDRYGSSGNVGEQNSLRDLAEWLTQRRAQMPTNTGVAIALGLILHSMAECDPTTASTSSSQQEQQQRQDQVTEAQGSVPGMQVVFAESHRLVEALLTKVWLPVVANAHESVAHKTTAVKGIASLTGALDHLIVQRTMIPDRNSWCGSSVLTRDVTSTLLDAMIRDVNATSQSVADTATLKAHHIWTLGLFHRTLTRTFSSEPATSYPSFLNLGSTDNTSSVLTEVVKAAAKDSRVFSMLVDSLGQSFDSPLPCFAWVQLQRHLYNREAQGAHVQRALVILAIENVKMTPSVLPLLEVIISSAVLDALEDASKDFLLDRLLIIVEVCDTTKVGPFLSLYKDRRLNSEDVRTAEEAWKLLASYIEDSSANSSSVYLILEMACYALPSTRARYYVARCLINFREVTLRDLVLRSLITPEKLSLRRALELRMALAGVIEMADIENPFTIIDAMGDSEFTEFLTECTSVNCPASVAENSVRWLLEILPQGSVSCHSAALLSLLASMMTEPCEWMDRITDTSRIEKQLLLLLPYRVDQMMKSKLWAPEAIKHVLQWLISVLENTSPSTHTYPVLHDTLMALRGKQEYRNNRNIWTRAVKLSSPTSI